MEDATISLDEDDVRYSEEAQQKNLGHAILVGVALLAVGAALMSSFLALRRAPVRLGRLTGILCALALALIGTQMMIGFPAIKALEEEVTQPRTGTADRVIRTPIDDMETAVAGAIVENFEIRYLPALHVELVLLLIPTLILANDWIDRVRGR